MHEGYYYFRNIGNRILFGGGRHLDFDKEFTADMALNESIQNELERILKYQILPDYDYDIEKRWTGIMGVGSKNNPLLNLLIEMYIVELARGMGIAIGCYVGKQLTKLI